MTDMIWQKMISVLIQFYIEKTYACLVFSYVFKRGRDREEIIGRTCKTLSKMPEM